MKTSSKPIKQAIPNWTVSGNRHGFSEAPKWHNFRKSTGQNNSTQPFAWVRLL